MKEVSKLKNLKRLSIGSANLALSHTTLLAEALQQLRSLEVLEMKGVKIPVVVETGVVGINLLFDQLVACTKLKRLELRYSNIFDQCRLEVLEVGKLQQLAVSLMFQS